MTHRSFIFENVAKKKEIRKREKEQTQATLPQRNSKQHHPTYIMEHSGKKSGGRRKNGARSAASGKKSNTKAKQGSQRGGRAGTAALSVPFGIMAPSTAKPDAFPTEEFYDGLSRSL